MQQRVVDHNELRVGEMRAVKVGGTPVLLVRLDDGYHALAGRCTHRPRPLARGTLHDGRIMCPRHQAAFDARTGDALEPPALDGLPTFPVEEREDGVYVTVPDGAAERRVMPMGRRDATDGRLFAIIGAGAAGAVAAETLRQVNFGGRVVMISHECQPPYDRPNCSEDYLIGKIAPESLPMRPAGFYEDHAIERYHGTVTELDVPTRRITFEDGQQIRPDAVLVASGAIPKRLRIPGGDLDGVFVLRSWEDSDRIIAAARGAQVAVIVGAGYIGLEVASSFIHLGMQTTVVAPEAIPLAVSLGPAIGGHVRHLHERRGVRFLLGRSVVELGGRTHVERVLLDDGEELATPFVVLGIGVRPATSFIRGVQLEADGSLAVDEQLRVAGGAYGVWAAGDVATYPEPYTGRRLRIEHWRTAQQHGKTAALSMNGHGEPFRGVPFFWTQQYRLALGYVGAAPAWDEQLMAGDVEAGDFLAYYLEHGQVRAAAGTRERQLGAFAELLRSGRVPPADLLRDRPDSDLQCLLAQGRED